MKYVLSLAFLLPFALIFATGCKKNHNQKQSAPNQPVIYEDSLPLNLGLDNANVYFLRSRAHPRFAEYRRALKIVNRAQNTEQIVELPENTGGKTSLKVSMCKIDEAAYLLLEDRWGKYLVNLSTHSMVPIYSIQHDVVKQYERIITQAKVIGTIKADGSGGLHYSSFLEDIPKAQERQITE